MQWCVFDHFSHMRGSLNYQGFAYGVTILSIHFDFNSVLLSTALSTFQQKVKTNSHIWCFLLLSSSSLFKSEYRLLLTKSKELLTFGDYLKILAMTQEHIKTFFPNERYAMEFNFLTLSGDVLWYFFLEDTMMNISQYLNCIKTKWSWGQYAQRNERKWI